MYQKAPITDRVKRIRERYRNTTPKIDINRYKLVTEFYMDNPQLTGILKRAKNLRNLFENMPTPVFEDDLIVGFPGETFRCCALYPEFSFAAIVRDLKNGIIMTRTQDPYVIDDDDLQYILETGDFWTKNCHSAIASAMLPRENEKFDGNGVISFGTRGNCGAPVGHFCGNHYKAVDVGFQAVVDEARAKMDQLEEEGIFGTSIYQYNFYRAVDIVCTGLIHYTERYAAECERQAAACTDEARKAELLEMADCLNWIMKNPARNFHDAIQIVYMYQMGFIMDAQLHGTSLGRIDQYTGKYYEADLAAGRITPERAQELVDCYALKLAENNKVGPGPSSSVPGYTSGQLQTIGGVDRDGNDATNPVTYMILQANARMQLHDPPIALRIHDGTPDELWEAAIESSKQAGGVPSYEYDGVIIPSLMARGLSLEDARDYALMGCVEPCGCGTEWAEPGGTGGESYVNIAVLLLMAINDGVNPMRRPGEPEPRRTGKPTGYLYDMTSIEEVCDAVNTQMEYFTKWQACNINAWEFSAAWHMPLPLMSAMQVGCMESGKDVMWGGSKYNSTGNSCVGVGNLADSLNILDQVVFKEKRCTTREMYDALMNDWKGYEELQAYIKGKAVHYGNGDPEADKWMKFAAECYADNLMKCTGPRGNHFAAGCYPISLNVVYGWMTPATPDGRNAGEALADGVSPRQGFDKGGPLTTINSLLSFDYTKYSNGTLCNMKFHPTALNRADGWMKLRDVMKSYFEGGGMELQLNIISADTLRAAQEKPDEYKDLVVRVAGFSAYFVEVYKESQDDLIRRTEMNV